MALVPHFVVQTDRHQTVPVLQGVGVGVGVRVGVEGRGRRSGRVLEVEVALVLHFAGRTNRHQTTSVLQEVELELERVATTLLSQVVRQRGCPQVVTVRKSGDHRRAHLRALRCSNC